jgi:hypothetical protein
MARYEASESVPKPASAVLEVSRTPVNSTPELLGARVTPWTAKIP